MEIISCRQCKRAMPEDNFRPLRGTRKKSRGRQKICKDCERLNNSFKRVHAKYLQDVHDDDVKLEHDQYLQWYRAIIKRDGGPHAACIPNVAREALGYNVKDTRGGKKTTVERPIDITTITKITEMQIKDNNSKAIQPGNAENTSTFAEAFPSAADDKPIANLPKVTVEEATAQLDELQDVARLAISDVPERCRPDVSNMCLIIEDMLKAYVDNKSPEEIYKVAHVETLESIAAYLDVNDEVVIAAELVSCLDSSVGLLIDLSKEVGNAKVEEVLSYLQAVLFDM